MAAELELGSELETHLRMFEEGARGLREFDWSAVNADKLLDGVRRLTVDQVTAARPALSEVKPWAAEVQVAEAAAFVRQLRLLRGGAGARCRWRDLVPFPVAVHR